MTNFRANRRVRTDQHALAALDAEVGFPHRNFLRDVALLPLRRADRISAVDREGADGQAVAAAGDDFGGDVAERIPAPSAETAGRHFERAGRLRRHCDFVQMLERRIDGREVLSHDRLAALAVGLAESIP